MAQTKAQLVDYGTAVASSVPTNGPYLSAANTVAISTNGSQRVTVDSTGKVGFGTASPSAGVSIETDGASVNQLHIQDSRAYNASPASALIFRTKINTGGSFSGVAGLVAGKSNATDGNQEGFLSFYTNNNTNITERARIDSSGRLLVGTSSYTGNGKLAIAGGTGTNIALLDLRYNSTRPTTADVGLVEIRFGSADQTSNNAYAKIEAVTDGASSSDTDLPGRLVFSTTADGASSPTERMRIGQNGQVSIGVNSVSGFARSSLLADATSGSNYGVHVNSTTTANGTTLVQFSAVTTAVGGITTNGTSSVAYNTTSDYRLKENVEPVTDGITRLQQLKPSRFNFIADPDKTVDGFIAHEVQGVVPEAITGTKDEVDADGNPVYQGIDQSKLVPLLTAALQEAIGRIETLEAEVAALKAQ